jgi:LacI family transcriptional regulator
VLEGQIAAETIDRMIRKHCGPNGRLILNTAKKIVERESARPVSPVAALLARAIAFIDTHAAENIKVTDVVEALGVSRSLLDQRFREFRNETIADAITARRLKEVARRLRQTNLSIRTTSASCGFQNPNHLKNLFKRKYGMSMREWRAKEESSNGRQ